MKGRAAPSRRIPSRTGSCVVVPPRPGTPPWDPLVWVREEERRLPFRGISTADQAQTEVHPLPSPTRHSKQVRLQLRWSVCFRSSSPPFQRSLLLIPELSACPAALRFFLQMLEPQGSFFGVQLSCPKSLCPPPPTNAVCFFVSK